METQKFTIPSFIDGSGRASFLESLRLNQLIIIKNPSFMKKVITLLIPLLVLSGFALKAQTTVTVGNGTTAQGWPYYTFYMDSRTQMLYTPAEMFSGGACAGTINQIGFNVGTAYSQVMNGFNVRLQNTSQSSFTGSFIESGWTTVLSGTYSVPGTGWQYLTLTTPFYWNGTDNLALEICFNNTSYTSSTTVYCHSAPAYVAHNHSDLSSGDGCTQITAPGSTYTDRPNTRFIMDIPASLPLPTNFTLTAVDPYTASVNLTPAPGTNAVVVYNGSGVFSAPTGVPPAPGSSFAGGTLVYNGTAFPQNITGLSPATTYYVAVWSWDGIEYSCNFLGGSFSTPCVGFPIPYFEGFEGITTTQPLPLCMAATNFGAATNPGFRTSIQSTSYGAARTGSRWGLWYSVAYTDQGSWLWTAPLNLVAGQEYEIGAWIRKYSYYTWTEFKMVVGMEQTVAGMNAGTVILRDTNICQTALNNVYHQKKAVFKPTVSGTYFVGFYADAKRYYGYGLAIDDISVDAVSTAPTCALNMVPANLATGIPQDKLVQWDRVGNASSYDVYWGTTNPPPFVANVTTNYYKPTGTAGGTTYYYKIVPKNAIGSASGCAINSYTTCTPSTAPYLENFESITAANQFPNCMTASYPGIFCQTFIASTSYTSAYSGTKYGAFYQNSSTLGYGGINEWFYTGGIYLNPGMYKIRVYYRTYSTYLWAKLQLRLGTSPSEPGMKAGMPVAIRENFSSQTAYTNLNGSVAIATPGVYYVGINALSGPTVGLSYGLSIDDISVVELTAPNCVTLVSPLDGATGVARNPSFTWTSDPVADSYDIYLGTTNPPTTLAGNTTSTTFAPGGLLPNTMYYWQVVPKNLIGPAVGCPVWSFTTGNNFIYCTSSATSSSYEMIAQVNFNTINNNSNGQYPMYTDYTSISTDVYTGNSYPITVWGGSYSTYPYGSCVRAFVDWNQDGTFDVNTEVVLSAGPFSVSQSPLVAFSGTVNVPVTAVAGTTRMRIVLVETSSPTSVLPCGTYTWGETEDYTVNVIPYDKDLTLLSWNAPEDGCDLTSAENVTVTYKNLGLQPQNNYTLSYFDGTSWTNETVTTLINPGQTLSYTFTTPANFGAPGEYLCKAKVTLAGDVIPANDEISVTLRNYPTILITDPDVQPVPGAYFTNFDSGDAFWYPYGTNNCWEFGTPAKTFIDGPASMPNAWVTQLTGDYPANSFCWVESPCFDLSQVLNPMFSMDVKYEIEYDWDGALLMYTTDNTNWYLVGNIYENTNWYNYYAFNGLPVWSGTTPGTAYQNVIHQLNGLGGQPYVKLGILFISDQLIEYEGFAFDNLKVYESTVLFASVDDINIEGAVGDVLDLKIKGGQPPYSVEWAPADYLSCNPAFCPAPCVPANCQKPIATPPVTTTYTAKVWDSYVPADTVYVSATVNVFPELVVDAQWDAEVCDTAYTQLYAQTIGGVPPYTYLWDNVATLSNGTIYNPVATPTTTTTYSVTVTDFLGFSDVDQVTLTVNSGWPVCDIHPQGPIGVCQGDAIQLTATGGLTYSWSVYPPGGATISNPYIANPWITPLVNGVKLTCVIQSPCGSCSDFIILNILPRPNVTLASFSPPGYCVDYGPVTLTGGSPAGGTYSGNGVINGVFYPNIAGVGIHNITYTYVDYSVNTCTGSATKPLTVYPLPAMNFILADDEVCINEPAFMLTGGIPSGGTYSGTGVSGGYFDPAVAGVGDHVITYRVVNIQGCDDTRTAVMHVYPLPDVTFGPLDDVCVNAAPFDLTQGTPGGGYYVGPGILISPQFNPAIAGVGTHTIYYYYTDGNGCVNFATSDIVVMPLPYVISAPGNDTICEGETVSLTLELAGTAPWTLTWMEGSTVHTDVIPFSPVTIDLTPTQTTVYTLMEISDATGCVNDFTDMSLEIVVNVLPLPYYVVMNDPNGHYCVNTGGIAVGLSGSEIGVTYYLDKDGVYTGLSFAGPGSAFWFYPNVTLDGTYTVRAVSDLAPTFCEADMTGSVTVVTDYLDVNLFTEFDEICLGGTSILTAYLVNPNISTGPYSFNWAGPNMSPNGFASVLVNPVASTWYYVTASDPTGCTAIDSVYIVVNDLPTVSITPSLPNPVCAGTGVTLQTSVVQGSGTSVVSYAWNPTSGLDLTDPSAPVATPSLNTTYHVMVVDDNGCEGTASIDVTLIPSPNVVFGGPTTVNICPGGSVIIPLLTPTIGSGSYSYLWTPADGLSDPNIQNPVASPAATTTYNVQITDLVSNCVVYGTYTVVVNAPIVVELGNSFNICNGTPANLFAEIVSGGFAPFGFSWSANPFVPVSPTQNPSVIPTPNTTTVFTVTVTDFYGCTATDNIAITSDIYPVAHAGANDTICEGECTTLIGSGGTSYQWFVNDLPITGVVVNPTLVVCPTATTTYELRVVSPCGAAISFVTVVVNPMTPVDMWIPQTTFCQNDASVLIVGSPMDANGVFTGDGITDNGDGTATFDPTIVGTYDITYTYTNSFGCEYSDVESVTVLPLPTVTLDPIAPLCLNTTPFTLTGGLPLGGVYGGPGVSAGMFNPSVAGVGTHTITYQYTDGNNCINIASIDVVVNELPLVFDLSVDNNGHYCAYPTPYGVHIYLSGSQPFGEGVTYKLILNGTFTGISYAGTGSAIDFGPQTSTGVYTVIAEYNATGCSQLMNGSATVVIDPLPLVYNVTGGGSYCAGGTGVGVGLDNSNYGITYYLYRNGSNTGVTHPGVNGPFFFADQTLAGTYTVVAVDDVTGCQRTMAGSTTITILPLPFPYFVYTGSTGAQSITACPGTSITIRQNANECGVLYELYHNGQPTGLTRTCVNGASFTWVANDWEPGVYTVVGVRQNPPYYCTNTMNGSVTISYYELAAVAQNPVNAFIDEGQSASFTVIPAGDLTSVSWAVSTDEGATWTTIVDGGVYSGASSNTLYVNNAPYSMTRYQYRAKIMGPCNDVLSAVATLYIDPVINVFAQNVTACASNAINVPIVFTNADSINAISLTIYFENTNFTYTGYTNLNPLLIPGQLSVFSAPGSNWVKISYFDVINTINTNHGSFPFLDLVFNGENAGGSMHFMDFDLVTQGACELSKISGELLTANFYNGTVEVVELPTIVSVTAVPDELCQHGTVQLDVNAYHPEGVSYAWSGPDGFTSNIANPVLNDVSPANAGTYYVTVTSLENGCVRVGSVDLVVYPEPELYTVILPNGDNACAGSGVEVAMDDSELGVTYELFLEPNNVTPVAIAVGTGNAITFGPQPVTGNYVVKATTVHGCSRWMNGSVHVQINPLPLWFFLQGGGHYCAGGPGRELHLNGSQIGVQYTLLLNACCCQWDEIVMTVMGTGSPISFGYITTPGYYSVVAMNPNTGCGNNMIGCIPIVIDPLPTAVIAGAPAVCYGECADITLTMTGTPPYTVVLNDGNSDFTVTAYSSPWPVTVCPNTTTTYTIVSVTDFNNCTNTGTGSATVTIWPLPEVDATNSTPVCIGGPINLYAAVNGFAPFTFSWSGPNGFGTADQNPIIPVSTLDNNGTYVVEVTDGHGCVNSDETLVVVNPLPETVLSANTPCVGGELMISGSNPDVSYSWTGPNGFTANGSPVIIAPAALTDAGIYTATIVDVNGCVNTFDIEVFINPLPVVTCGSNSPVCVGQTINLTAEATGNGPFSYYWTGPEGFTSMDQNPYIMDAQLVNAGDYIVMVYDANQCMSSCTTTVVVNPLPEICPVTVTEPNVFCFGCIPPQIMLGCSQIGVNYELYRGGVATGIILPGTGTELNFGYIEIPGWYTVYAVNATTGCSRWMYGEVEIIEQAPPSAVITGDVICFGETAEMQIALTGDTYWDVIITDGVNKDTIHITSTPYTYIPGNGPHILAPTVTTTYTILLVSDRVCYNIGNSAVVTVNPLPNKYTVTGGGYYCSGIGVYIGLNGSQLGIEYTLHQNGFQLNTVVGTGGSITFGPQAAGVYWVQAVNPATGCTSTMNGQAIVLPDPGLEGYEVSGGGSYCQGGEGLCVYLSGSQLGKEYKLLLGGLYTGTTIIGTGSPLAFCNLLTPGTYSILVFDPVTTCTRTMNGYAQISVQPLPTATIGVDATICYGDAANIHVDLTGTAPWTFIISDGINSVAHTSYVAAFDSLVNPTSTRTYIVTSVVDAYCQNSGSGSALITVNSPVPYVVTGGGAFCEGGSGVVVGLSGSQVGVIYTLFVNGVNVGQFNGTGNPLSFGPQTVAGNYTVVATNQVDGCSRTMNGVAIITINPLPNSFNVTGGGACCIGCTHVFVCLDGSQVGIRYELYINNLPSGIYRNGTGQPFCYDYATVAGTYTIKAVNISTGCWRWMNGSAEVVLYPTAQANISGNASICAGGTADLTITFTEGTAPFSFGLTANGNTVTYDNITANPYILTVSPTVTSVYTLAWVSDVYGCYNNLTTGSAVITVTQLPGVEVGPFDPVCIDVPAFELTGGMPSGGVYSGVGVDNGWFDPAVAGPGSHVITYTYTDIFGCQGYASAPIVVNPLPDVSFSGLEGGYCVDAQSALLVGNQAPYGYFVGPGITDLGDGTALFNPAAAGIGGPYTITYVYTDPNGCTNATSQTTNVIALPDVYFTGLASAYCVNNPDVQLVGYPAGGVFSGHGVTGNVFSPAAAGVGGPYTITYSYTSGSFCTNSYSLDVTVLPLPQVCELIGGDTCCIGCSVTALLMCSEQGVSYQLVRNGNLFVGAPKMGTGLALSWEIFLGGNYTVIATNLSTGCTVQMNGTVVVTIIPQPSAVITGTTSICEGQCAPINVSLTGTPPFEIWFSNGPDTVVVHSITAFNWDTLVCPTATTTYAVVSLFDAYCGAFGTGQAVVTVNPAPAVFDVTGGGSLCEGGAGVPVGLNGSQNGVYYQLYLDGISTGIVMLGNGNPISFGLFNVAGEYTVVSESALTCTFDMNGSAIVTVVPLPTVTLEPFAGVCEGEPAFMLTGGLPLGGMYYVDGIQVDYFDAGQVGVGMHEIMYTYTDGNGCEAYAVQSIMVYANPAVSLQPFASVCFDVPEFVLGGGAPAGGDYYVNGVMAVSFDPGMYGAGTYTITYMYTDGNGCTGSADQSLTVYALPSVTLAQFAPACLGGDPIVLTGGLPLGGEYSGMYVTNGVFDPVASGIYTITYTYTNQYGCTAYAMQDIEVAPCPVYSIGGQVTYDNNAGTVMNNVTVNLKQNNVVIATTVTDVNGYYLFENYGPGTYQVAAASSKPWGGVNSNDALMIMKHFAAIAPLTGLRVAAANVNGDGVVNSIDALMVAKRFVNQISSFPVGDWVFQVNTVVITSVNMTNDFVALCYGDVNGSYTPPYVKTPPTVNLNTLGVKNIKSNESFELPIHVSGTLKIGAVSLILSYPEDLVDVEGVVINAPSANFLYTAVNGELRISWYAMKEVVLNDKDVLLTLQLKSRSISGATSDELALVLDGVSELGDRNAAVIQNVNLTYPKLAVAVESYSISNYPNPFKDVTEIVYNLPEDGTVTLKVYNLLGDVVATLVNNVEQAANTYQVTFDGSNLVPGIYTYKIEVKGQSSDYLKSGMMVISR